MSCKDCKGCQTKVKLESDFNIKLQSADDIVIALAGNPNVGKSTVFNHLTGLKQHTGNWPGKTVANARGTFRYKDKKFVLMDLPGTYSLLANSVEEEVARDFICFGKPAVTVVVVDATCLERNLNLVLQVMEITDNVILCLNLMDEAKRKNIHIDINILERELGIPIVPTSARKGQGLDILMEKIYNIALGKEVYKPLKMNYSKDVNRVVDKLVPIIDRILQGRLDSKWVALRLLDGDKSILDAIYNYLYIKDKDMGLGYELKEGNIIDDNI